MRRTDLIEATMQGWARLDASQRQRFFEAFVAAAVRLDRLELRAWLRRRLKNPPLAEPIDLANLIFGDAEPQPSRRMREQGVDQSGHASLLRAAGKAPGEAAAGPDGEEADGG